MPSEENAPVDLLDLRMLPAWVKETPDAKAYAHYEGETAGAVHRTARDHQRDRRKRPTPNAQRPTSKSERRNRGPRRRQDRAAFAKAPAGRHRQDRHHAPEKPPPDIAIRFVPQTNAFENVAAQIKGDMLAYSLFSLARLFLQKPERYDVHLAAKPETPLYQLGENGAVSADKPFLENNAFRFAQKDFYKIDISQSEPIKGNFTSVARERTTGTLLGPTNHHAYQPKLRALYEQRFSRRMSFQDFQRQIEIVNDLDLVEKWKQEAQTITTFTAIPPAHPPSPAASLPASPSQGEATELGEKFDAVADAALPASQGSAQSPSQPEAQAREHVDEGAVVPEETPQSFTNAAEAEKHFRQNYLPNLVRTIDETMIDGVSSRNLPDRVLRRAIENAWTAQTRSPSQMMAELSTRLREAGLHIFRHRKGMLFVSPVRVRALVYEETSVSAQVRAIVETIAANPRMNRKDFAEKVLVDLSGEELEARKLSLASDLKWLISEGYVIEFNDGSLDLPKAKTPSSKPQTPGNTQDSIPKPDLHNPDAPIAELGFA